MSTFVVLMIFFFVSCHVYLLKEIIVSALMLTFMALVLPYYIIGVFVKCKHVDDFLE